MSPARVIEEGRDGWAGHLCPGLVVGIRAAEVALREIGPHAEDEEVVAIVETDVCAVDAIRCLVGCTFGKGSLIHAQETDPFTVTDLSVRVPTEARVHPSIRCEDCREDVMETRIRHVHGRQLCIPCLEWYEPRW